MAIHLFSRINIVTTLLGFLFTVLFFVTAGSADTRYVHDILIVDVRDTMGKQYKVLATVKTGDSVEVLEESKHFVKVKTGKGIVGYVAKQYINKQVPKKTIISNLQAETRQLNKKIALLHSDKENLESKLQAISAQNDSTKKELGNTTKDLEGAYKQIETYSLKNKQLQDRVNVLEKVEEEKEQLQSQVKKLEPRITALQERYDQVLENNKEAAEIITERDALQDRLITVQADMEFLQDKHQQLIDSSQDLVAIIEERDALLEQAEKNTQQIKELRERNDELEGTHMVYWFLAGAGVLLIGMLIGKASVRKKRSGLSSMMIAF